MQGAFRCKCIVIIIGLVVATLGARADTFDVADGDVDALTNAIDSANALGGTNTILLATNGVYTLTGANNDWYGQNGLPAISSTVIIEGNGATIARDTGATAFRLFYISGGATNHPAAGGLTLRNVTLSYGFAQGGNAGQLAGGGAGLGGAIFNQGELVLDGVTLQSNAAVGGNGGSGSTHSPGGGGGLGGNGGAGSNGGGGGGGFGGNGGNGSNGGGGGGSFGGTGGNGANGGGGGAGFNSNGGNGGNGGGGGGGLDAGGSSAVNNGGNGGGPDGGVGGVSPGLGDVDGGAGQPGGSFSGGGGGSVSGICTNDDSSTCGVANGGNGGDGGSDGGGGGGGTAGSGNGSNGGTGGNGGVYGGGGGGGSPSSDGIGIGGNGGLGAGGGGGGSGIGGNGGIGGGGGGAGHGGTTGGAGGFGGGGGAGSTDSGGAGGFGGGGAGAWTGSGSAGGFGGGAGVGNQGGGGGGAGIGGAIFSDSGASLFVTNSTITGNTAQGGAGGGSAQGGGGIGGGIFSMDCPFDVVGSVVSDNAVLAGGGGSSGVVSGTNAVTFVADTNAPTIACSSALMVDGTTNTGAVVSFDTPTVTDDCDNHPVLSSTPESGSLFAFGTTTVTNTATDISGNVGLCTFDVTVLDPRGIVQDVLADVAGMTNSVPARPDGKALAGVIQQLMEADSDSVWTNGTHLNAKLGKKAFSRLRSAISKLDSLKKKRDKTIDDATLTNWEDRLAGASRVLAVVAIDDAISAGGNARKIAKANAALAGGDAGSSAKTKIARYEQAWKIAITSYRSQGAASNSERRML